MRELGSGASSEEDLDQIDADRTLRAQAPNRLVLSEQGLATEMFARRVARFASHAARFDLDRNERLPVQRDEVELGEGGGHPTTENSPAELLEVTSRELLAADSELGSRGRSQGEEALRSESREQGSNALRALRPFRP